MRSAVCGDMPSVTVAVDGGNNLNNGGSRSGSLDLGSTSDVGDSVLVIKGGTNLVNEFRADNKTQSYNKL